MRVVIDTNRLQTDELIHFLAADADNYAVLPEHTIVEMSCPLLSGPSTMTVWIKEGTTNAFEEA